MSVAYPAFDGTQECSDLDAAAERLGVARVHLERAFDGVPGADPGPAKTLCERCEFRRKCRAYALNNEAYGVWGATTEDDRAETRRRHGLPVPEPTWIQVDAALWAMPPDTAEEPFMAASVNEYSRPDERQLAQAWLPEAS